MSLKRLTASSSEPTSTISVDEDFDAYWDEEARNPLRNRIRIGRQYQASIPPLLKSVDLDTRKLEDLETLRWKPNLITDSQLSEYIQMAKIVAYIRSRPPTCESDSQNSISKPSNLSPNEASSTSSTSSLSTSVPSSSDAYSVPEFIRLLNTTIQKFEQKSNQVTGPPLASPPSSSKSRGFTKVFNNDGYSGDTTLVSTAISSTSTKPLDFLSNSHYSSSPVSTTSLLNNSHNSTGIGSSSADVLSSFSKNLISRSSSSSSFLNSKTTQSTSDSKDHDDQPINYSVTSNSKSSSNLHNCAHLASSSALVGSSLSDSSLTGQEIKPLRAKPIYQSNQILEKVSEGNGPNNSNLGSLKFYLDGELVLKLQAQSKASSTYPGPADDKVPNTTTSHNSSKETASVDTNRNGVGSTKSKVHWVESADSAYVSRLRQNRAKRSSARSSPTEEDRDKDDRDDILSVNSAMSANSASSGDSKDSPGTPTSSTSQATIINNNATSSKTDKQTNDKIHAESDPT